MRLGKLWKVVFLVGLLLFALWLVGRQGQTPTVSTFHLYKQADVFVLTKKGIKSYRFHQDRLILQTEEEFPLVKGEVNVEAPKVAVNQRYLIFSDEGDRMQPRQLLSLDFQEGKVLSQPITPDVYGLGQDDGIYYYKTASQLIGVRPDFSLVSKTDLTDQELALDSIQSYGDRLYALGQKWQNKGFDPLLLTFQKTSQGPELVDTEWLGSDTQKPYVLGRGLISAGHWYLPILGELDRSNAKIETYHQMLDRDLATGESTFWDLPDFTSAELRDLGNGQLVLIAFDHVLHFIDVATHSTHQVTVSDFNLKDRSGKIYDVKPYNQQRVLILVGNSLVLYDSHSQKVLWQDELVARDDEAVAIWVKP